MCVTQYPKWFERKVDGKTVYYYGIEEMIDEGASLGSITKHDNGWRWKAATTTHLLQGIHPDLTETRVIVEAITEVEEEPIPLAEAHV